MLAHVIALTVDSHSYYRIICNIKVNTTYPVSMLNSDITRMFYYHQISICDVKLIMFNFMITAENNSIRN